MFCRKVLVHSKVFMFCRKVFMASHTTEVLHDFSPLLRVYKDGRIERLEGEDIVPPSVDPSTGVQSKDVEISPEIGLSARLYRRQTPNPDHKLPLLIYFHGGAFVIGNAFAPIYHNYLNLLVAEANAVVVSVNYRRAPEYPLPIAYEDSWAAVKWVASHSTGDGQEPWLNDDYVDFKRVFFAGDSAGGNIAHNMGLRVGSEENLDGVKLVGIILAHPYFWGVEPVGGEPVDVDKRRFIDELWCFANPLTSGADDPLINPGLDPNLSSLGCNKVLVCVAEKDLLKDRGWHYYQVLGKSGWGGKVEIMETKGEGHVFHLFDPRCENAMVKLKKVASFINQDDSTV